jgi:hypothetical protein
MNSHVRCSRLGTKSVIDRGVTLLPREALETKAVGGSEHSQGGGCRLHYLDGAQRAVQLKGDSRMPSWTKRDCTV